MARSNASARAAGATHERTIADYLAAHVDDRIDRRVKTGAKDKGDIASVRTLTGGRVAIEAKNCYPPTPVPGQQKLSLGPWLGEAEAERINDGAIAGVVIAKRHGVGAPGSQLVVMTVDDLVALLTGVRP